MSNLCADGYSRPLAGSARRLASMLLILLISFLSVAPIGLAQEIHFLAIQGEGTASVVVDEQARSAIIADGGRADARGIVGAKVEGKDILAFLLSKGITKLAVSCSHPDADHMDGLKSLVGDKRILKFNKLLFIDNGQRSKSNPIGLSELYARNFGIPPEKVNYVRAVNRDAFDKAWFTSHNLWPSTFKYDPEKIGTTAHDSALIMQYEVGPAHAKRMIVDFDDSSQKLVEEWVGRSAQVNILLLPHHGSRNNKIDSILRNADKLGLSSIIISVNRNNRYRHPAPELLVELLQKFPGEVFITDSDVGENVSIDSQGHVSEQTRSRSRSHLLAILDARIRQGELLLATSKSAASQKRREARGRRLGGGLASLRSARELIERKAPRGPDDPLLPAYARHPPPRTEPPPTRYRPMGTRDGTGDYQQRRENASRLNRLLGSESQASNLGANGNFYRIKNSEIGMGAWGGIILGAQPKGPKVRDLEFIGELFPVSQEPDHWLDVAMKSNMNVPVEPTPIDRPSSYTLRFTLQNGAVVDYAGVSPLELWSAYNFVQPTASLSESLGWKIEGNEGGLVGRSMDAGSPKFGIHPAIANSPLAISAMRLDTAVAAAKVASKNDLLDAFALIPEPLLSYDALQWYDDEALISVHGSQVNVRAQHDPTSCLMRLRQELVRPDPHRTRSDGAKEEDRSIPDRLKAEDPGIDDLALEPKVREQKRMQLPEAANELPRQSLEFNKSIEKLCESYGPLVDIDRLARVVTLLNWYKTQSRAELPQLPAYLEFPDALEVTPDLSLEYEVAAITKATLPESTPNEGVKSELPPVIDSNVEKRSLAGPVMFTLFCFLVMFVFNMPKSKYRD